MIFRGWCAYFFRMTTTKKVYLTPIGVRGMTVLDRDKFLRNLMVPILKVAENTNLSKVTQSCRSFFLKLDNFKPVQDLAGDELFKKCIYLNPEKISDWTDIPEETCTALKAYEIDENNFDSREVELCYENWSYETIFKAVLPEGKEGVSGFSQIGHIIHLNLRDHLLDYRQLIGQVLLDKLKTCRTVINKDNVIDNTYRNFSMELLAGEENYIVTVKENRCNFKFDFSKVYWNPRLCKEHERILDFLEEGDTLFDVFAGVGPFSIPAAKRNCTVFANDLNPESYNWLNHNAKYNKVDMNHFQSFNLDGKDFICNIFKEHIIQTCPNEDNKSKIHITMNLPALALDFVKYFKGLISDANVMADFDIEIIVYVYCFVVEGNDAMDMLNISMGCDMKKYVIDIFNVRNVSPKKDMMRVTFKLTKEVLCGIKDCDVVSEPPAKKLCVDVDNTDKNIS
ncbi:tRNA (guanine(37)-N1)-methyltransferase [Plodia interpunctella]|uniref:tRNA (guanine(37)-N1)-methyltransferase n=1 Tax=Plodia interpunctella TaxID=58824 RepID=UPI002368A95E|nr:tRNA (guanine(37)-N1)-methyltransferase [Plodia interpunctella]